MLLKSEKILCGIFWSVFLGFSAGKFNDSITKKNKSRMIHCEDESQVKSWWKLKRILDACQTDNLLKNYNHESHH